MKALVFSSVGGGGDGKPGLPRCEDGVTGHCNIFCSAVRETGGIDDVPGP